MDSRDRGPLGRLLGLAWDYRAVCLRVLAGQLASLALALGALGGSGLAIDVVRRAIDPGAPPVRWPFGIAPPAGWSPARVLVAVVAGALVLATLRARVVYGTALATGRLIHVDLVPALRARVFDKLLRLGPGFFQRNASGSIINRVTADVQSLRSFIDGVLLQGALLAFTLAVYVAYMVHVHVGLTVACLAPTPLLWLATSWFSRWARPAYERSRALSDAMVLAMSEGVKGIRVTKTFGAEAQELERFRRHNRAVRDQQEQIFRRVSRFAPTVSFITAISIAILLGYGGALVARDAMTLGQLVVFAGLLQQFATQITGMATIVNTLEQSVTAARRVFEVLDAPIEVQSPAPPAPLAACRGAVRFEDVSFGHGGALALDGVDFAVEPGRCVAFVGPTGAGKSTLLALVSRFADPSEGRVLSTASTCARWIWTSFAATSAWSSRRACSFAGRSRRTSRSAIPRRAVMRSSAPRGRPARTRSSRSCRAATTRRSRKPATTCRAGSGSAWRSRAPSCWTRRSCCSTIPPARSTCTRRTRCCPRSRRRATAARPSS